MRAANFCQYSSDTNDRSNTSLPHAAQGGVAGADPPAHRRERRRAARHARPVADVDQCRRGACRRTPLDPVPPFSPTRRRCSTRAPATGRPPTHRPTWVIGARSRAPTSGCAWPSTSSTPTTVAPSRCSTTSSATRSCPCPGAIRRLQGVPRGSARQPHGGPPAARSSAPAHAGSHRTRDRLLDLEVARPGAAARRLPRPRTSPAPSSLQPRALDRGCASQLDGSMVEPERGPEDGESRYVLITQCLQNDFLLNDECRLSLPEPIVRAVLLGQHGLEPKARRGRSWSVRQGGRRRSARAVPRADDRPSPARRGRPGRPPRDQHPRLAHPRRQLRLRATPVRRPLRGGHLGSRLRRRPRGLARSGRARCRRRRPSTSSREASASTTCMPTRSSTSGRGARTSGRTSASSPRPRSRSSST